MLKITETDIIKRTALLKFLQILDGFHTPTEKKKLIFFSYRPLPHRPLSYLNFEMLKKFNLSKIFLRLPKTIKSGFNSPFIPDLFWNKRVCSKRDKICEKAKWDQKPFKLKINYKSSLSIRNFRNPLVWPKRSKKDSNRLITNSIQNNIWFPYDNQVSLSREPQASKPKAGPKKSILDRPSFSAFESVLQTRGVPKWEIYLKNQPSNKSLNLLCVWPSYIEDIMGPFNLNDSGSYILPEYFQLLGHGPKLKKQGITLIASTNNLTTLDAALLRPGRFDTIVNFSYSFSSIDQPFKMLKHSACLKQNNRFSYYKLYNSEKEQVNFLNKPVKFYEKFLYKKEKNLLFFFNDAISLSSVSQFSLNQADYYFKNRYPLLTNYNLLNNNRQEKMIVSKIVDRQVFSASVLKKQADSTPSTHVWDIAKQGRVLYLYPEIKKTCSRIPYLTHTRFGFENQTKEAIKNNFYSQLTTFNKPNQSSAIKTFLDVSIFMKYKLWWSFHNEKLLWLRVDEKSLMKKSRIHVSNSEKLKTLQLNIYNGVLILPSKIAKLKDLTNMLMGILRMIYLRFFYKIFKFFMILRNKLKNQAIVTGQTSVNQNSDLVNDLSREVLTCKVLTLGLSKKLSDFDFFLEISDGPKAETSSLVNYKNKTTKNFIYNIHTENNNMFLKSNRSFLFCTGDFNYKTSTEKDDSIVLVNEKSYKKKQFLSPNNKNPIKNIVKFQTSYLEKKSPNYLLNSEAVASKAVTDKKKKNKTRKKLTVQCEFGGSMNSVGIANIFLDQSSKTWKPFQATAFKNVKINHVRLTKYNEIYKLKKIKFKQQFFFNLHPFTSLILKRWPEITKLNKAVACEAVACKLKRYLKVPLVKNVLPQFNFPLYSGSNFPFTGRERVEKYPKNKAVACKAVACKQNSSVLKNFWFLDLDKKSPHNQIYQNLYSMTVLIPANISWLGSACGETPKSTKRWGGTQTKQSSKTIATDSFFSTYESYLLKKLSTNASLNITCLQTYLTLTDSKKSNSWISSIHLPQTDSRLKKIPRKTFNHKYNDFQTRCKVKNCNATTNQLEINNNIVLLKNPKEFLVSDSDSPYTKSKEVRKYLNVKKGTGSLHLDSFPLVGLKEHNFVKTRSESFFQNYKMCRLDVSFFLLTFYTMFFEKIQVPTRFPLQVSFGTKQFGTKETDFVKGCTKLWGRTQPKTITLNTIKIFMPYKSLIVSHFLLSQSNTYDFSCKNFEILIYNKFKNFLVDF